jgi:hypothetical protein
MNCAVGLEAGVALNKTRSREPRGRLQRLRGKEDGQAALEFMLVIPVFLIFIGMVLDFGIMAYEFVSVANAGREGARFGATNCGGAILSPSGCSVNAVQDRTIRGSGGIVSSSNRAEISVGWIDRDGVAPNSGRGDSIVVSINHTFHFPFLPGGPGIPIKTCVDMRLERRDLGTGLVPGTECSAT